MEDRPGAPKTGARARETAVDRRGHLVPSTPHHVAVVGTMIGRPWACFGCGRLMQRGEPALVRVETGERNQVFHHACAAHHRAVATSEAARRRR